MFVDFWLIFVLKIYLGFCFSKNDFVGYVYDFDFIIVNFVYGVFDGIDVFYSV